MAAREILWAVIESSFGTTKTSPVNGTDAFYARLSEMPQGFPAEMQPQFFEIPYGGGRSDCAEYDADAFLVQGSFDTVMYPGIWTSILLGWAFTEINSGRTTPWTTTDAGAVMPEGDHASLTLYNAYQYAGSGTYKRGQYLGCKNTTGRLYFAQQGNSRVLRGTFGFVGIKRKGNTIESSSDPDATEFPAPAETDYPTGPWLFSHLGNGTGTFKIASARPSASDLEITWNNVLDTKWYQSKFPQIIRYTGREMGWTAGLRLTSTVADDTAFHGRTAQDVEFLLDNGTNTMKFDFHTSGKLQNYQRQTATGLEFAKRLVGKGVWNASQATMFTHTLT